MISNLKQVFISVVIGVVASTVLLAKDINATTYEPLHSGIVHVIPLNNDQVVAFQVERANYKALLQQLKETHENRINKILNVN